MRKIKIVLGMLLMVIGISIFPKTINASSGMAGIKGFNISGWEYLDDLNKEMVELETDTYNYGYIGMWSGVYGAYNTETNEMWYTVFVETKVSATGKYNSTTYFANQYMDVTVKIYNEYATVAKYDPEAQNSQYQITRSFTSSTGFEIGSSNTLSSSISYGYSVADTSSEVQTTCNLTGVDEYGGKGVHFRHNFSRYNKESAINKAPYKGEYIQRHSVTFCVPNYYPGIAAQAFSVEYIGAIYKLKTTKAADYSYVEEFAQTYTNI